MEPRDYRFYKISKEATEQIKKATDEIQAKRQKLLNEAIESVGAKGVSFSNSWGENGTTIRAFAFAVDKEFDFAVKELQRTSELMVIRAKANSKKGKEFNAALDAAKDELNKKLKDLPCFKDYIINKFDIQCCSISQHGSGAGMRMLETIVGYPQIDKSFLICAIPNHERGIDKQPSVPDCFEEITYGVFYDLSNSK
ncbi:DUF5420 family protein [Moellerella wisconsensis]|uniref:DUF5420 family protein n=1 Tax=Moellerella wisconsensis TaxID=158849 RepID=UPI0030760F8D